MQRSGKKEYLALIKIDPSYLKPVKFKSCGKARWWICKGLYKGWTGILEILTAAPLQISMNNSKEDTVQGGILALGIT